MRVCAGESIGLQPRSAPCDTLCTEFRSSLPPLTTMEQLDATRVELMRAVKKLRHVEEASEVGATAAPVPVLRREGRARSRLTRRHVRRARSPASAAWSRYLRQWAWLGATMW